MKNKWKSAFFILLVIMVIVPIIVVSLIFFDDGYNNGSTNFGPIEGEPIFTIESSKEQLNYLIKEQLVKLKSGSTKFNYDVRLRDKVTVNGYFTFFSDQIEFSMDFEPEVLENGNLLLKEESIRLGALSLPGDKILEFIKGSTDLPEWVEIDDNKETILVKLTEIELRDHLFLKAESFDLENDEIRFKMYYKTPQ
ncbi:YpmS family protein [Alkalihalobacillus sp. AL-G]|uniref:YpmS family protein n=1 Tax=Alkalihalobacillus sp. AL-G TaxID=2926399 RepID=UPI00272D1DF2|nr:YpmS family protein [Alkalihalobacillus sp. AL-G]WLD94073.1 YpmS family protein [Alkalihalobacillus sp. AL-G]